MKRNFKILSALCLSSLALTGCIDETLPEGGTVTAEQIGASATALEASVSGIPASMSQYYFVYGEQTHEIDMGYPMFMIGFTQLMGDMYPNCSNTGYDWFRAFNISLGVSETSYYSYLPWYTLYKFVKAANGVIGAVDLEDDNTSEAMRQLAGVGYAFRALDYYTLTVCFEPVENIYTDCSKVLGLTVPIVTESTTEEEAKNNPRASHDDMIKFILSDLDKAEELLANYTPSSKLLPDLSVVYGLKARVYMWDQDYANAAKYARLAISNSGATPITQSQWEDVNTGFNTSNQAWLWSIQYSAENMGNLCNFTGWMSSEADWGYSSITRPSIDASLYNKIADTDFRKHSFIDPNGTDFYDYQSCRGASFIEDAPAYMSLKFRCLGGDYETYSVGGAVEVPIMRVEEMYLIEAYATGASQGVAAGTALLNSFMQNYRQSDYNYTGSELRDFELEVLTQMRIEFWGEGEAFPIAKLLQPDVIQNYEGTNAPASYYMINCKGIKPDWNFAIPIAEVQNNPAIDGYNNPNPTATFGYPIEIGQFAPGYADSTSDESSKK